MESLEEKRLKWKCRRGLLELDLVLTKYLEKTPYDAELVEFLDLQDNDLWDIVSGRSSSYPPHLNEIVARLRAA